MRRWGRYRAFPPLVRWIVTLGPPGEKRIAPAMDPTKLADAGLADPDCTALEGPP